MCFVPKRRVTHHRRFGSPPLLPGGSKIRAVPNKKQSREVKCQRRMKGGPRELREKQTNKKANESHQHQMVAQ